MYYSEDCKKLQDLYPRLVELQKMVNPELPDWDKTAPFLDAVALLSQDLRETVDFIDNFCTPEQLVWMSVIATDVAVNLKDRAFTDAMRKAAIRFSKQIDGYNVDECICDAEKIIKEGSSR